MFLVLIYVGAKARERVFFIDIFSATPKLKISLRKKIRKANKDTKGRKIQGDTHINTKGKTDRLT